MGNIVDHIAIANRIREELAQLTDDQETIRDTLEGETDIFGILDWLLGKIGDEDGFAAAVEERIDGLQARLNASKGRRDRLRSLLQSAVEATGEKSLRRPEATVSLTSLKPGIAVIDETVLPERFFKVERRVDRSAVNAAIRDGEVVPGVVMGNGGTSLTVRRK